ncbi:MAG TPA: ABC transporter transmembrane domain-containing protein [Saprospiraceae bacterium]|nr:ABC transporter transmembrane domain-containing protein [Saprospiraceae bacterium]
MSTGKNDASPAKKRYSITELKESARIFRFIRPYRWQFITGMLLLFLSSMVFMVFPYLAGEVADTAIGQSKLGFSLNRLALIMGVILVAQGFVSYFRIYLFAIVSEKGMADVRKALYQKLISLPVYFFEKNRVGNLTSRITDDVGNLQMVFSITLAEFVRQVLILIVGIGILMFTTPHLSLIMLATFPVIVIGAMLFGRFIRKLSKQRQEALADANVIVEETLQNIHTVKSFVNEPFEYKRYSRGIGKVVSVALNMAGYRALFSTFIVVVLFGGIFFILWWGARMVQNGEMTIGQLVAFIVYTAAIGGAIGGLGNFYSQLLTAVGGTERIREILNEPSEVSTIDTGHMAHDLAGIIEFRDVHFEYPSRPDIPVLRGVNMLISEGTKIALVGQSGAGKSTIAALLLRYYNVTSGNIFIDDIDIREIEISAYRHSIGLVPQEVLLFGGTIRENILYGKPDATEEELVHAAQKSYCLEFIETFPEGFETIVGERGIKLSGGQRQRVAIARAILKDPKILILDEATSSLDSESEFYVQQALDALMEGRTSVIIAHRLSTIKSVDCIYVIEEGKIVEAGTHDELSRLEDGRYSMLAKLQFTSAMPAPSA